jgi:hypothetical protein
VAAAISVSRRKICCRNAIHVPRGYAGLHNPRRCFAARSSGPGGELDLARRPRILALLTAGLHLFHIGEPIPTGRDMPCTDPTILLVLLEFSWYLMKGRDR